MEQMVKTLHYTGTDEFSDEAAAMLAQAMSDVAELVEALEKIDQQASRYSTTQHLGDIARTALARFKQV